MILCNSSYKKHNYNHLITSLVYIYEPKTIIEVGILEGYSLKALLAGGCKEVKAFDLFEEYPYSHAIYDKLKLSFGDIIYKGNFYSLYKELEDSSIDMFHIDISNTGDTYECFFENYMQKLTPNGVALLEGGSIERDNGWIKQFNKRPIRPVLKDCLYQYFTFDQYPSLTLVKKEKR